MRRPEPPARMSGSGSRSFSAPRKWSKEKRQPSTLPRAMPDCGPSCASCAMSAKPSRRTYSTFRGLRTGIWWPRSNGRLPCWAREAKTANGRSTLSPAMRWKCASFPAHCQRGAGNRRATSRPPPSASVRLSGRQHRLGRKRRAGRARARRGRDRRRGHRPQFPRRDVGDGPSARGSARGRLCRRRRSAWNVPARVVAVGRASTTSRSAIAVMAIAPAAFSTHVRRQARRRRQAAARLSSGGRRDRAGRLPHRLLRDGRARRASEPARRSSSMAAPAVSASRRCRSPRRRAPRSSPRPASAEKRRFLETLGADHVFDSRSLALRRRRARRDRGEGVDVVLNSLFAEAMERSLALLKPFGRFLELGKRDYYADTQDRPPAVPPQHQLLRHRRRPVAGHAPDLTERLLHARSALCSRTAISRRCPIALSSPTRSSARSA